VPGDLRNLLHDEIAQRLADHDPELGEGDRVASFPCPSGAMGDVVVDVGRAGAIVHIAGMTHGHFDDGTAQEIAATVADFLGGLFNDEVVVWRSPNGAGGWFYLSDPDEGLPPGTARAATWSGPLADQAG
jgi:hypothetical protein